MRFGGQQMHLKVLPVKVSSPPAPVGFITVKDRTLTPLAARFIDCARKVANLDDSRAAVKAKGILWSVYDFTLALTHRISKRMPA